MNGCRAVAMRARHDEPGACHHAGCFLWLALECVGQCFEAAKPGKLPKISCLRNRAFVLRVCEQHRLQLELWRRSPGNIRR